MPRTLTLIATLLIFTSLGCVSKKELAGVQAELDQCRQQTAEALAEAEAWEQRFDRESSRWANLEASVSESLPGAIDELEQERDRIVALVPDQVRDELEGYLDAYFTTVAQGFKAVQDDNRQILRELESSRKMLESVGVDTRNIGTAVDTTLAEERDKLDQAENTLAELSAHLAGVVDQLVEFDQSTISCKDCPERLRLNRKERETILGFHSELMAELADLQSRVAQ